MPNASRHNLSRAGKLFQGSAAYANYELGKDGIEMSYGYQWKPRGNQTLTFTATLAAGAISATLNASWGPPTGFYSVTLSTGQVIIAYLTQSATTCTFWAPLSLSIQNPVTATVIAACSATATVAGCPPVVGVANAYSVSASIAAAGSAVLGGTLASGLSVTINGTTYTPVGTPDVPRNVVGAWTTSSTVVVSGFDQYGQAMTETQTGSSFTGKKAFAYVTSITSSAAVTAATFGTGNVLGLPFTVKSGDWMGASFNDVAGDAGTFVQRDFTNPATTSTGDTRGTYTPGGTLNGNKFLVALMKTEDTGSIAGSFGMTAA